jgi:UDP-N-acetylglucosamine 2-epimerase (non-hydrolysing)/GDP/UDP-N,N'-diacetylbacillosamine 2-epimerase (hydrolysing)
VLAERLALDLTRPIVVFTQHSVTTEFDQALDQLMPSLIALEKLASENVQVVMTYPNNDAGGRAIIDSLKSFAGRGLPNISLHSSLGRANYHGILSVIAKVSGGACLGNSSSGIKETPAFGCPAVNIGSRQDGRLHSTNLLGVGYDAEEVYSAVRRCIDDSQFVEECRNCANPYGGGDAGARVADALASTPMTPDLLRKKMTF